LTTYGIEGEHRRGEEDFMRGRMTGILALAAAIACGGGETVERAPEASSESPATEGCDILTAEDVQSATATSVSRVERDPMRGLGGTCANFVDANGQPYLGVNRHTSSGDYATAVGAVPEDLYPTRTPVSGLGDEAVLMSGEGGLRYLVARKNDVVVVLFPLGEGMNMSDDQLRALAERALSR
jgi:hypothetical protein